VTSRSPPPASTDPDLLGECQRSRLIDALGTVIRRTERGGPASLLLMISVNALDAVNARLGHDIGDQAIAAVGQLLKSALGSDDSIVRYASNTFAVILFARGAAAMETEAGELIARVRNTLIETSAGRIAATIAVGGVTLSDEARTGAEAAAHALAALDIAKMDPSHAFVAHRPADTAARAERREISVASSVMEAIEENRMLLVLQPIVNAVTGQPALYEALLRLRRTDGSLVSAADFIEEAEKLGLARLIDRRTLELAVALLNEHERLELALNVSSLTAADADWLAALETLTRKSPALLRRLTIEITETAMIHDLETVSAFAGRLRALGCRVAIDDFGAGFTSFRNLKTLRVDMLKIDGLFVKDLPNDHQARALIQSMIDIARAFDLVTVAEWVTTEEDAAFLRAAGVTCLQGYLYGAPAPVEDLKQRGLL